MNLKTIVYRKRDLGQRAKAVAFIVDVLTTHGFKANPGDVEAAWSEWSQAHEAVSWCDPELSPLGFKDHYATDRAVFVGRFVERYFTVEDDNL